MKPIMITTLIDKDNEDEKPFTIGPMPAEFFDPRTIPEMLEGQTNIASYGIDPMEVDNVTVTFKNGMVTTYRFATQKDMDIYNRVVGNDDYMEGDGD